MTLDGGGFQVGDASIESMYFVQEKSPGSCSAPGSAAAAVAAAAASRCRAARRAALPAALPVSYAATFARAAAQASCCAPAELRFWRSAHQVSNLFWV